MGGMTEHRTVTCPVCGASVAVRDGVLAGHVQPNSGFPGAPCAGAGQPVDTPPASSACFER